VFNLLNERWLPARRADGQTEYIRPAEITGNIETNPVTALDWPRADFRVACIEFLIGLIATAYPPADDDDAWVEGWEEPPPPDTLATALAPIAHAFNLDGPGPRFLQDFDELPGEPDTAETLLIEAPGEETRRKNAALLVKADRIVRLSRPAAAMALFTLQCYAPQGGRGHRTSVRGGGPLTTLALPGINLSFWHLIWANVPAGAAPSSAHLPRVFPWLAPTRTGDQFPTTQNDAHRLQAFWGMPRRIRLDFAANMDGRTCDLTGVVDTAIVTGWRQQPHGVKYVNWDHPFSPSRKDAKGGGWITLLAKSGIGYRDWVAIALGDAAGDTRRPAQCITTWRRRSANVQDVGHPSHLLAAGYHMVKSMKAYAFIESEMPLPGTDLISAKTLAIVGGSLVAAAEIVANVLRFAVRRAIYRPDAKVDGGVPLNAVYERFWAETQDHLFSLLPGDPSSDRETALDTAARSWRAKLKSTALSLFDEVAPLDPSAFCLGTTDPRRPERRVPRIVEARHDLLNTIDGRGPKGRRLFEVLRLPSPEPKGKRRQRAEAREMV
jgi:CRISPR system Cascade subunit CasA